MRVSGSLAQSVEHLTFNQVVARSNRARPTTNIKGLHFNECSPFLFLLLYIATNTRVVYLPYYIHHHDNQHMLI